MAIRNRNRAFSLAATSLFALTVAAGASANEIADNTPPNLRLANDHGIADATKMINITVHLKMRDEAAFDRTLDALYTPGSPRFHKWLSDAELKRFAPEPAKLQAVRAELERNGLKILSTDLDGFSIRARGSIGNVAKAFNTEIHEFDHNGQEFRANVRDAHLSGIAGSYVNVVAGIESHTVRPTLSRAVDLKTGKPRPSIPLTGPNAATNPLATITDTILSPSKSVTYTTPKAKLPKATYTGLQYDEDDKLVPDYVPTTLEAAYNLPAAYKSGLNGKGQTVVLLEGYGDPTMESDANSFSKITGLPKFTAANFEVKYPEGAPFDPNAGVLTGWDVEISLDIDSAHAIAPGAKIFVVATSGQDSEDFQTSMQYIIDNKIGYAVSDSWEEDTDLVSGPEEQESYETILKLGAAKGVSFQFSTGDGGDGGLGTPIGAPGVPSVAPHSTAVGGTAILNVVGGKGVEPVGWGDSLLFVDSSEGPEVPPIDPFFAAGGGGGSSVYWDKPNWQAALPGKKRQEPDISALADPYTGVPIVVGGAFQVGWGGTSLASPIFTAIWAIADQKAGKPLGVAGILVAGLKTGITDVLPLTSKDDLTGSVTDSKGKTTKYTAAELLAGVIPDKQPFISALWNQPSYSDGLDFGFGLDSSLTVTKGWDNATGYGTPQDALAFINAAVAAGK